MTKSTVTEMLARIPGPANARWPQGEPFAVAFGHGTMSVELYAPRGRDHQTPHTRDELYFVARGTGEFVHEGQRAPFAAGDAFFVPAGDEHRFENFSDDFATWVVFWGPEGGEKP
ncbi:MAG TPA: cupin domain-containing protein [Candidatus Didemnitutus sp.]|nr:cupin domain-containing protein [Candidatus Didemnitutus sp.]